ncbi:MAG TPA: DUF2219 domain-containing protein [Caulobacteraceae bacterium]
MRWQGMGALIVAAAATAAHAQAPSALAPLNAAVFDSGKPVPTEWKTTETKAGEARLQLSVGGERLTARGAPALSPLDEAVFEPRGFDVRLSREWPAAVRLDGGVEITPHADVGFSDAGPGAGAGATVSFGDRVANRLGVRDGKRFGDQGRWYLFAATSGRSVGLNLLRGENGQLHRAGWSVDGNSALVSDAQAGIGWRKGPMQASLGYMRREIKPKQHGIRGMESQEDDLVAISFSFKPR